MEPTVAIDIGRQALETTLIVSGPMLIAGLLVGVLVGIFQAVTQIHEMTLTFIPKILVMVGIFLLMLPWILIELMDYTVNLINLIPQVIR